jgi:plasmid stability protein
MKTTLDLPDELMRTVKVRAAEENRKLKDVIADLLRRGLSAESRGAPGSQNHVELPLVQCAHPAAAGEEITPDRAAELLAAEDAQSTADR